MQSDLDYLADRFEIDDNGCWLWTGYVGSGSRDGYGRVPVTRVRQSGESVVAHRFAWRHLVGPIPDGFQLDHLCRIRRCINPDHLEPVTNRHNALRGISFAAENARKTHCPQGHPYNHANTYVLVEHGKTRRCCRACNAEVQRRRRERTAS